MGEPLQTLVHSDEETFFEVLDDVLAVMAEVGARYLFMGGLATTAHGGHRFTHDIDVFCRKEDCERILEQFGRHGFRTERTDPGWIFKAFKNDVMVDLIFQSTGPVQLDDEMIERSRESTLEGRKFPCLCPEDLFTLKSLVFGEPSLSQDPKVIRHLNDVLMILRTGPLDWDYIVRRGRLGPRRFLGMLFLGQSYGLAIPDRVIHRLLEMIEITQPGGTQPGTTQPGGTP